MKLKPNSAMNITKWIKQLLTVFLVLAIMPIPGYEEESYSQTPAQEGVCDLLNDEGMTKGLYSLYLAFCGEQDFVSSELPLMEENRESIQTGRPEEQLLDKYNETKKGKTWKYHAQSLRKENVPVLVRMNSRR